MAKKGLITKALVLAGSLLAATVGLVIIRETDRGRLMKQKIDSEKELVAVPEAVLINQKVISDYREQKFREISTEARETKVDTSTSSGTAPAPASSSSASSKKKSSSGGDSSSGSVSPAPSAPKTPDAPSPASTPKPAPAPKPAPDPKPAPAPAPKPTPPPVTRTS